MENYQSPMPTRCPACGGDLMITQLQCTACATEVTGAFALGRLASLREPHASLLDLFLRVRGNMKEMERLLGLSYPTVRARLEEALAAAGLDRPPVPGEVSDAAARRKAILDDLEQGTMTAAEAAARLREIKTQ